MVIAANAGGAWTPIGDVTTTMLWIHGQISTLRTMQASFESPSFIHQNRRKFSLSSQSCILICTFGYLTL